MHPIKASAIKFFYSSDIDHAFPQIWTARRHADILERMFHMQVDYDKDSAVQGFITEDDRFVDRYWAMGIACTCNQVSVKFASENKCLYSEDLWPDD